MGKWTREKVNSENLNGGNQYEAKDRLSREQLNAMVNSGLYSQDFAEHLADTPDTSEASNVGIPSVELVNNGKYKKFKFSNLKGEKGDKGDKGDTGDAGAGVTINGVPTAVNFKSDPQTQLDNINEKLENAGGGEYTDVVINEERTITKSFTPEVWGDYSQSIATVDFEGLKASAKSHYCKAVFTTSVSGYEGPYTFEGALPLTSKIDFMYYTFTVTIHEITEDNKLSFSCTDNQGNTGGPFVMEYSITQVVEETRSIPVDVKKYVDSRPKMVKTTTEYTDIASLYNAVSSAFEKTNHIELILKTKSDYTFNYDKYTMTTASSTGTKSSGYISLKAGRILCAKFCGSVITNATTFDFQCGNFKINLSSTSMQVQFSEIDVLSSSVELKEGKIGLGTSVFNLILETYEYDEN